VSSSPPTSLKCSPPGGGDVSQDGPGGPLYQPKPAIKNSLRKSSRNYARALLILTVFGCISGYHVDALPIEKHDALIKCDVPTFNLKRKWDLKIGDEYDFLVKETENLKGRNGKKQNWATTDECNLPLPGFESHCDLLFETNAKSVRNWFQKRFDDIRKPSLHTAFNVTKEFKKLLKEKNYLDHQVKEKKQKCESTIEMELSPAGGLSIIETSLRNTKLPRKAPLPSSSTSIHASPANFKIILFIFTCVFLYH